MTCASAGPFLQVGVSERELPSVMLVAIKNEPDGAGHSHQALTLARSDLAMADTDIPKQTITLKLRLRDKHARELNRMARAVSVVWNYVNEIQQRSVRDRRRWPSAYDLQLLTNGAGKLLDLHAHTVQGVCKQYDRSRKQHGKAWLKFRGRKSLGWIPFNTGHVKLVGGRFKFRGVHYEPMHMRDVPEGGTFGAGSFGQDRRGRWYINVPVEMPINAEAPAGEAIGIDLGLKDFATLSTGAKIKNLRHYRQHEQALAVAQRANKKRRVKAIAAKVTNSRKDHHHKVSAELAKSHGVIVVGNVSAKKLARTRMAKSVLDAGWSSFRTMISYKAMMHGGIYVEADERFTSQVCSSCGVMPETRPRGIADLGKRVWTCGECGTEHDRDTNAALNIRRIGLDTLRLGAPK